MNLQKFGDFSNKTHFSRMAIKATSNHWFSSAREELTNITTLKLVTSSGSILEKILWALIAIGGTIFIYNVVDIL